MSRLARFAQQVFASTAALGEKKKFGSLAAGVPANAINVADVQALSNYLDGLFAGVVGPYNPAIEDINSLFYMITYQLAYSLQSGIPEWDATTEYFAGSIVTDTMLVAQIAPTQAKIYVSLKANNTGNALTDKNNWAVVFNGGLNPQASATLAARAAGNWISRSAATADQWRAVVWSPELSLFAAVSGGGTIMTSPDGVTWTARTSPSVSPWGGIAWSPERGLFCAVAGAFTAATGIMTSPDGITWTNRTAPAARGWNSIAWSPELGLFVSPDNNGAGKVMNSSDGIIWTEVTAPTVNAGNTLVWSSELLLFVSVGSVGAGRAMTSPDGLVWTQRTISSRRWFGITWSPNLGAYVAVSDDGFVSYSYNGVNWTEVTTAPSSGWNQVAWSPELGVFVAVGNSGAQRVMYSYDGITWVGATAAAANSWAAVTWSPQKGLFVALSSDGANRVMNSRYVKKFTA